VSSPSATDVVVEQPTPAVLEGSTVQAGIRRCRPSPGARAWFRSRGHVGLDDLWTPTVGDALAEEAGRLFPTAVVPSAGPRTPVAALRRTGASTPAAGGPVLEELHTALASLVRALSGRMLVPSFAVYGYFPEEDGVVLHLDTDATDIVLLTTALGEVGPLVLHPDLEAQTPRQLGDRESDPRWDPGGGVPLSYPSLGVAALRGARIPHGRPSRPVATLSAVAALHYRSPY